MATFIDLNVSGISLDWSTFPVSGVAGGSKSQASRHLSINSSIDKLLSATKKSTIIRLMIFGLGVLGGIILVLGSALPEKANVKPMASQKNWLFAIANLMIFSYALLDWYFNQAPVFFVILETLILISTVCMMRPPSEKVSALIFGVSGTILSLVALSIFEGYQTLIFVAGLSLISFAFALPPNHPKRNLLFAVSSALIAWFSYLGAAWIFFWLNAFFALFSTWHHYRTQIKP